MRERERERILCFVKVLPKKTNSEGKTKQNSTHVKNLCNQVVATQKNIIVH